MHSSPVSAAGGGTRLRMIDLTWHLYCLHGCGVASGQKLAELQRTICEICAGPTDELDNRQAIRATDVESAFSGRSGVFRAEPGRTPVSASGGLNSLRSPRTSSSSSRFRVSVWTRAARSSSSA